MKFSRMLNVVDCHAEGESGKVVVGGVGNVPGQTRFDKLVYLEQHLDQLRELLLFEPRGRRGTTPTSFCHPTIPKPHWATSSWSPPNIRRCRAPTPCAWPPLLLETGMLR